MAKKPHPFFSIVMVSFNTKQVLKNCLDSIYKHTKDVTFELVIVDNGSKDGTVEMLKNYQKKKENLKLIISSENLGFGRGNNLGTKNAEGEYLCLLNTDTLFTYNLLKNIKDKIKNYKNLGAYSCQLLNDDLTFQSSGGYFPTLSNLFAWQFALDDVPFLGNFINSFHPKQNNKGYISGLEWVTGAFMVIEKKTFNQVKGFDEKIFMYTEEMELLYRISKLNKKVVYDKAESLVHLGRASGGSFLAVTSEVKYLIYFWQKHKPKQEILLVRSMFFVGSLLRLVFFGIIKQNASYRKAYLEALRLSF